MSRILSSISFVLVFVACLVADSNLHITDVGLHGYYGTPSVVRLIVRNPSPQSQVIHLKVATSNENADVTNTVTIDVPLSGGEHWNCPCWCLSGECWSRQTQAAEAHFSAKINTRKRYAKPI
jgi:hypothetical protein